MNTRNKRIIIEGIPEDVKNEAMRRLNARISELMPKMLAMELDSNGRRLLKDATRAWLALNDNKRTIGPNQNATIWCILANRLQNTVLSAKYEKFVRSKNRELAKAKRV